MQMGGTINLSFCLQFDLPMESFYFELFFLIKKDLYKVYIFM